MCIPVSSKKFCILHSFVAPVLLPFGCFLIFFCFQHLSQIIFAYSKSVLTYSLVYSFNNDTISYIILFLSKVSKGAKIRKSIQSSNTPVPEYQWESDKLTADTTNESHEVSPFPAGDHKAHINRRAQRHSKHKTEQKHKRSTKEVPVVQFYLMLSPYLCFISFYILIYMF